MKPSLLLLDVAATTLAATAAAAASDAGGAVASRANVRRHLSYQKIAGYAPSSQVTDHCAIDLDQAAMEAQLALKTSQSFANAQRIYNEGGNSKSYARVTLTADDGLKADVSKGDRVMGRNNDGLMVAGKVYEDYEKGAKMIKVQYDTTDLQEAYVGCQVGGLVEINTKRCFLAEGDLKIANTDYPYTYDRATDNRNGRTIAGFSEGVKARDVMRANPDSIGCRGCPYKDFSYFYDYYGTDDYAHQFIQAAFEGTKTQFIDGNAGSTPFVNGNADFSYYDYAGREQFIKRATASMNIFMWVIRQWEVALDDCERGCMDCNKGPTHFWDEGVCFYTGSIEGQDGRGDGRLLRQLADDMCGDFRTCGVEGIDRAGTARANYDLFGLFALGNFQLLTGNCPAARATKDDIARKMYGPLIQGAVLHAHKAERTGGSEELAAEGAAFAAAVLPRVHAASPRWASVIYDNLKVGATATDPRRVKHAFEQVYQSIGISCADIGGLWDKDEGKYYDGMQPCVDAPVYATRSGSVTQFNNSLAIILGCTFGALFAVAAAMVIYMRSREKEGQPVFKASTDKEGVIDLN